MFERLKIDKHASRTSFIKSEQYDEYHQTLTLPSVINTSENRIVKVIGERASSIECVIIQVPYNHLNFAIKIFFTVIDEYVPMVLSMKKC